ncbi:Bug family tripartite tricarboxylate transporter substrate binding protein [Verminephrobacter eiseniae]|uniref:Bug family tripartite tricarboxylate transporter substrate binding protein n=1 Tax=Verminephrobacter eiseniae TaxID=364317 RepID=UPI00223727AA|nr:tripartite tricarboxylate transporter substrate binding protein [Verminephrobacter eiseniae]MCW5233976.1 tripartite tricarboxylate transporter substrate binding protein [Verminephrobacter eiseniae]MCW5294468.1 tripartite tricarboxylate transporter substrate binding protein [Verminephrobacter eiseniae]MCW8186343.1 tripartite tricarboxylate transporter substrate binding protein [Verminephrobacter eiseniae]MCW8224819.1 tripartite tricarboxylate transporter substrate binding protein [Verminephro
MQASRHSRSGRVNIQRRRWLQLAGLAGMPSFAQTPAFPSRPMRFIVPFPPGSGTDITARLFAKSIGELAGQPVTVENKPGGNGFIGVQTALSAPHDGHTVFIGSNSTLSTNAAIFRKLPYDPIADFAPITLFSRGACLIIVPARSAYRTLGQLVADARKRPGQLNYASGSMSYLLYSEWFNELAQMKTTAIHYKGAGEAVNAVLTGEVDFAVVDASGSYELARSGRVRALAFTASERSIVLPEVPAIGEAGWPEYLAFNWVAAAVSAKTPAVVVEQLGALFAQAGQTRQVQDYYRKQGTELIMSSAAGLRRYQTDEIARWKRLMDITGIGLQ